MEDKGGDCLGSMGDQFRNNLKEIVRNEIFLIEKHYLWEQ
jgi:hypothetical protein